MRKILTPFRICILSLMVFFAPLCGFLFRCGCTYLWSGAARHCNINDPAPPDCPWCVMPFGCKSCGSFSTLLQAVPFLFISSATYGSLKLLQRFRGKRFWRDLLFGFSVMIFVTLMIAWLYARLLDYPQFRF